MSYQKCPTCGGTGKEVIIPEINYTVGDFPNNFQLKVCSVCNGYKIISELTGLPPSSGNNTTKPVQENLSKKQIING